MDAAVKEPTVEEICGALWRALDKRAKTLPYSTKVKEAMDLFAMAQNNVRAIEYLVEFAGKLNNEKA